MRVVPAHEGQYMARDDELVLPKWFSLPGGKKIGLGRRLVPTSWDVFPEAWELARTYMTFNLPPMEHYPHRWAWVL